MLLGSSPLCSVLVPVLGWHEAIALFLVALPALL